MNDKESLTKALKGAHSVFAVTNYWEKLDDKHETQQGRNVADVSKVRHAGICQSCTTAMSLSNR